MKKNILIFLCILLVPPSLAFAAWTDDFLHDYDKLGIDRSVENALANNVTPKEILAFIVDNDQINNKESLKALYCAGANRDEVHAAASKLGISERELANALEESIAECAAPLVLDDRDDTGILASPSKP
jgi:phosphoglycerate dehydrogenase-like enzyme